MQGAVHVMCSLENMLEQLRTGLLKSGRIEQHVYHF